MKQVLTIAILAFVLCISSSARAEANKGLYGGNTTTEKKNDSDKPVLRTNDGAFGGDDGPGHGPGEDEEPTPIGDGFFALSCILGVYTLYKIKQKRRHEI